MNKLVVTVLGLSFLIAGCTKTGDTGTGSRENTWTHPHVLTYADAGDIDTLNPHLGQSVYIGRLGELTMAWLWRFDKDNNPEPELATNIPTQKNGGVSADGLAVTVHLRRGVKWSDGAPFNADDVVFSTGVVLNPANNEVGRQGWDQITKTDEPDKYTVVWHFKRPYSPFIQTFFATQGGNPCILPKHLLAKYPNINNIPYNAKPVGIGPFVVDRWDRAQQVVMTANPLYWRGRPKLDKIVYRIIPDRNTVLSQLQAHEIDMWPLVPGNFLERARGVSGYAILDQPGYNWNHVDFNLDRPALKDVAVRRAILYAFDRQTILRKIGHGLGTLSDSPTPINAPYAVKLDPTPFDIAKANSILDKAGWARGADGVRAKNGVRLSLSYAAVSGLQDVDDQLEIMRSDWKQIGVDLSVKHYPGALYFAPLQAGGIIYGDKWDLTGFAWVGDAIGDFSQIYGCDALPPNGQNDPRWCNPVAQHAMTALYQHFDQAQRNQDVKDFMTEFQKDMPVMVQLQRHDVYAYNKDLKNYDPNEITPFDDMMNVDI